MEAITYINIGYMIRAPTFRRSTQRQEPHPLQLNTAAPQNLRSAGDSRLYQRAVFFVRRHMLTAFCPLAGQPQTRQKGYIYGIFNSAVDVLQTLVVALGAGLGIWGVINLMEGYGNDNPGAKSRA